MFDSNTKSDDVLSLLPLQRGSEIIVNDKRLLPGEDIKSMRKRVSRALARPEKNPQEWFEPFEWMLDYAFCAGRIGANLGAEHLKPAASTINCTVSETIPDSMRGIMDRATDAAVTLKAGCGIGYDFTTIRPRGAQVTGVNAFTSGVLPFMDIFDSTCKTVRSSGDRRGAQMGCLDIQHPDVIDFIRAKRQDGRLRSFNLSVLINTSFLNALAKDEDWPLVFPARSTELAGPLYWRYWPEAENNPNYTLNELGQVACRIYRYVKASKLWEMIMRSTYDFSDPGFIMIDEYNLRNPLWFAEDIRATNPCVTADTWVQTAYGPRQVGSLIGHQTVVRVNGIDYLTGSKGFFKTDTKSVVKIRTREGYEMRLTPDHRVLRTNVSRYGMTEEWVEAGQLSFGDTIRINDHRQNPDWTGSGTNEEGYLLGLLLGDGCLSNSKATLSVWTKPLVVNGNVCPVGGYGIINEATRCAMTLEHRSDFKGFYEVPGRNEYRLELAAIGRLAYQYGMCDGHKVVTPIIEASSSMFCRGFLRGLFDTDGSIQGDQNKGVSVRLSQNDLNVLRATQRILIRLGIASTIYENRRDAQVRPMPNGRGGVSDYFCQAQHELCISGSNIFEFANQIGFADTAKQERLIATMTSYVRAPNRERFVATIESITSDGFEDVYDVQVPGINAFDANGFIAHNCGEQGLPPGGSCLLGSVNLASLIKNPFSSRAEFNWDVYKQVIGVFSRALDNVVEMNNLPVEIQRKEIFRKRRHGMGYLGLGSALTMMGMKYGSPESVEFTSEVSKVLAIEGWKTGLQLAKEKGAAPILNEEFKVTAKMIQIQPRLAEDGFKVGDVLPGKVLHARYSRYFETIATVEPKLVEELAEHGCRYSHCTSLAPTGTMASGEGNNTSNGIEPSFNHYYVRNLIVPGKKTKQELDVYSYELLAYKTLIDPNVDPKKLPACFDGTTSSVDPKKHVDIQAAAQPWIDSSISKTINVPTDYPYEDFKDLYQYGISKKLKGGTTFRFNPEVHTGVLVNHDDLKRMQVTFEFVDGDEMTVSGDTVVYYDGEEHLAANLFDAIKEGVYGTY